MLVILDYGVCNVGSIQNMLKKIGEADVVISHDKADIEKADHLILPGVGAFDVGMQSLARMDLIDPIRKYVLEDHKPLLGICLGMQMLGRRWDLCQWSASVFPCPRIPGLKCHIWDGIELSLKRN